MLTIHSNPVAVLGVPIDNVSMSNVLTRIEGWIHEGGFHQVATANTDFLIKAMKDEELGEILRRCDLVMADGMPLIWASKLLGKPLQGRITGSDLVPHLAAMSARRGYRIFMLGAREQSLDRAAAWMQEQYPAVQIVGRFSPPYAPLETMDHESIFRQIEAATPDILLVAFGNPKQEKWLSMHRHRLQVPVCIGVGGSFDFLAGAVSRAPEWMQRNGLEWFYRTMQEPRRLAGRYVGNAMGLMRHLPGHVVTNALQGKGSTLPQITTEAAEDARVIRVSGDFSGPVVARFEQESAHALAESSHIVLDLSRSSYLGPDALAVLIRVLEESRFLNREFWITGLHGLMHRAVRSARLGPGLRTAPAVAEAMRRIVPAEYYSRVDSGRDWNVARLRSRVVSLRGAGAPADFSLSVRSRTAPAERKHSLRHLVHGTSAMSSEWKSGLVY